MRFLVLALFLSACPKPTPPPITPPTIQTDIPTCPTSVEPRTVDVCDGLFTKEGYACVNCKAAILGAKVGGCLDVKDQVYCATDGCLYDSRCKN